MRCTQCDGSGAVFSLHAPGSAAECPACEGTGREADDEFEARLREAVAKIGMVYVVRDDANSRIKIGTALNPLARLRDLQTGSSVPLHLIAMFAGGRKSERSFQETWAMRRLQGEWFDDADREISRIILWTAQTGNGVVWPNP